MKILITNDDGVLSPVLTRLADILSDEHEVIVAAPSKDQSGMAQAFTHYQALSYKTLQTTPYPFYEIFGTPTDCVKFVVSHLCKNEKIDLIVSGINLGENAGISAIYSGTVAAAREGAMWGLPALALSISLTNEDSINYSINWLRRLLHNPELLPNNGGLLNINFPACDSINIKGTEITTMSTVMFSDSYVPSTNEHGLEEFKLKGYKPKHLFQSGSDDYALRKNRISITPLQLSQSDMHEHNRLRELKNLWNF